MGYPSPEIQVKGGGPNDLCPTTRTNATASSRIQPRGPRTRREKREERGEKEFRKEEEPSPHRARPPPHWTVVEAAFLRKAFRQSR